MAAEPSWVSLEAVVALNRAVVAETNEPHELRDRAALGVAVRRPWNTWAYFMDHDHAVLAATLMGAVFGARAFAAGNKRTAFRAALAFLDGNGYRVATGSNRHAVERAFAFCEGRLSHAGLVEWFRLWMEKH